MESVSKVVLTAMVPPPSLTIVIPSKNREGDVLRCLASIDEKSTQPDQIIVVDQSPAPYRLDRFPTVLHLHCPNLSGLTAARNYALKFIHSQYVLFLDDDVEMLSDCVKAVKCEFLNHPGAAAIGCSIAERNRLSFLGLLRDVALSRGFFNRLPIKRSDGIELRTLGGAAMAFRKSVLAEEQFDEALRGVGYGEDFEYSIRARRHGRFWLCPSACLYHHVSHINRVAAQQQRRNIWNHTLYFYDKFDAGRNRWNRLWLLVWMISQSILWLRLGMGLPPITRDLGQRLIAKKNQNVIHAQRDGSAPPTKGQV